MIPPIRICAPMTGQNDGDCASRSGPAARAMTAIPTSARLERRPGFDHESSTTIHTAQAGSLRAAQARARGLITPQCKQVFSAPPTCPALSNACAGQA
jgi:hypothetical protein